MATTIRQWHSYFGLFIAPSVLFFALTGSAQIFNLHEAHGSYRPPALLEKLSSVHKDQVFAFGGHHLPPPPPTNTVRDAAAPGGGVMLYHGRKAAIPPGLRAGTEGGADRARRSTQLLKWFFLIVGLCLTLSTGFGIWMGLTQIRAKRLAWLLLVAGTLIPVGLLLV
jgi:hypothetical protein